jgi:hypothetical protein
MSKEYYIVTQKQEFYDSLAYRALSACNSQGFQAMFMPGIIDERIRAPKGSPIWSKAYSSRSIMAFGRGKSSNISQNGGTEFVVYAHVPNYLSDPKNLEKAINEKRLVGRFGLVPEKEFQKLLDMEDDDEVFVVDSSIIKNADFGMLKLTEALNHPHVLPFLGGRERAEKYLQRCFEVYGDRIGVWSSIRQSTAQLGRLLQIGENDFYGLTGCLEQSGRFLGIKEIEYNLRRKNKEKSIDYLTLRSSSLKKQKPEIKPRILVRENISEPRAETTSTTPAESTAVNQQLQSQKEPLKEKEPSKDEKNGNCSWFVDDEK